LKVAFNNSQKKVVESRFQCKVKGEDDKVDFMDNKENTELILEFQFDNEESLNSIEEFVKNQDLDYDVLIEDEEFCISVYGCQKDLIEVAAYDHKLHGDGFSFNPEEAIEAMIEF
jgi:hypothetical protein